MSEGKNKDKPTNQQGLKYDDGKLRLDLLPIEVIEDIAVVLGYGAKKYSTEQSSGDWNWAKGFKWSRLYAAALRHLFSFIKGEGIDRESGLPHLSHALCCLVFLRYHERHGVGMDDRRIGG